MSKKPQWPNLFLIGAPRAGTTSLYDILSNHPDIYMSRVKEPNFFSTPPIPKRHIQILGATQNKKEYLDLFKDGAGSKYIGEGTTHYMSDPNSAKRIYEVAPDAKIIAIIRNPIERAYSAYLLLGRQGKNNKTFYQTLKQNINDMDKDNNLFSNFAAQGLYSEYLKKYYKYFRKRNILVLSFDDLKSNRSLIFKQLSEFLDIDEKYFPNNQVEKNQYKKPRNKLFGTILKNQTLTKIGLKFVPRPILRGIRNKVLLKKSVKSPIDSKSYNLLTKFYKDELKKFDSLLTKNQSKKS